jgi:hypothetical protein
MIVCDMIMCVCVKLTFAKRVYMFVTFYIYNKIMPLTYGNTKIVVRILAHR